MKDDLPIIFVSTMPRSGSTLLQNLLAQNPLHHCTSTNGLVDMLACVRERWMGCTEFVAQGLKGIEPRIRSLMAGMVEGFYRNEFAARKTVFDKSRGWLSQILLLENILQRPVKVVVAVRDLRDVLASFEKIYRRSVLTDHPSPPEDAIMRLTVQGRAERLLQPRNTVGYVIASLQGCFEAGLQDRLVIVPYSELTNSPQQTINRVCLDCGLEPFTCDPLCVHAYTKEDDTVYGMYDLHSTRSVVEPERIDAWRGILPDRLAAQIDNHYQFIQQLSRQTYLRPTSH